MAGSIAASLDMNKAEVEALAKAALADSIAASLNMNKADVYKVIRGAEDEGGRRSVDKDGHGGRHRDVLEHAERRRS